MASWDCDFFRKDSLFGQAEINAQYAGGGGSPFVGFRSDWLGAERKSGAKDADAPKVAPFYWGIKDVQYSDAQRSKTWKKAMLKKAPGLRTVWSRAVRFYWNSYSGANMRCSRGDRCGRPSRDGPGRADRCAHSMDELMVAPWNATRGIHYKIAWALCAPPPPRRLPAFYETGAM
ncbi:unnamed protein product [Prorocentrum cordatum]|uniref:Uncharacterized protein n=1 Tax=Prorocentrum cordatum TaxID=2364126 RepID=A0ABN9U4C3_9DINO|nr:unnamed protein product [Polarella glacialis]